jgi:hypothetical protein
MLFLHMWIQACGFRLWCPALFLEAASPSVNTNWLGGWAVQGSVAFVGRRVHLAGVPLER